MLKLQESDLPDESGRERQPQALRARQWTANSWINAGRVSDLTLPLGQAEEGRAMERGL